jgi:hypothetical protein
VVEVYIHDEHLCSLEHYLTEDYFLRFQYLRKPIREIPEGGRGFHPYRDSTSLGPFPDFVQVIVFPCAGNCSSSFLEKNNISVQNSQLLVELILEGTTIPLNKFEGGFIFLIIWLLRI